MKKYKSVDLAYFTNNYGGYVWWAYKSGHTYLKSFEDISEKKLHEIEKVIEGVEPFVSKDEFNTSIIHYEYSIK